MPSILAYSVHCFYYHCLVMVQPRKIRPDILTEKVLTAGDEKNQIIQTNKHCFYWLEYSA